MSMPTGAKFKNGYATVSSEFGGMEYRLIAEKFSEGGEKISVSTARNLVLRALEKLAIPLCEVNGVPDDKLEDEARRVSLDPRFQSAIASALGDMYA